MKVSKLIQELENLDPKLEVRNYFSGTKLMSFLVDKAVNAPKRPLVDRLVEVSKVLRAVPHGLRAQRGHIERRSHPDGMVMRFDEADPRTILTSVTYLNDEFDGGCTVIRPVGEDTDRFDLVVRPRAGRTVFFNGTAHYHGVSALTGVRYTMPMWYMTMPGDFPDKSKWWEEKS